MLDEWKRFADDERGKDVLLSPHGIIISDAKLEKLQYYRSHGRRLKSIRVFRCRCKYLMFYCEQGFFILFVCGGHTSLYDPYQKFSTNCAKGMKFPHIRTRLPLEKVI